ncbi:hypothetical protein F5887DRAFT_915477 [Amanita rubescens]|nr:hypothetical protein F5887DRAFT_915477 [Amanita rubescens]
MLDLRELGQAKTVQPVAPTIFTVSLHMLMAGCCAARPWSNQIRAKVVFKQSHLHPAFSAKSSKPKLHIDTNVVGKIPSFKLVNVLVPDSYVGATECSERVLDVSYAARGWLQDASGMTPGPR